MYNPHPSSYCFVEYGALRSISKQALIPNFHVKKLCFINLCRNTGQQGDSTQVNNCGDGVMLCCNKSRSSPSSRYLEGQEETSF